MRILFDSKNPKYKSPTGTLCENMPCSFSVYVPKSCRATAVKLRVLRDDYSPFAEYSLKKSFEEGEYECFSEKIAFCTPNLYFYYFHIKTVDGEFSLYREGFDKTNMHSGELWQVSCIESSYKTPDKFKGKTMYQIFPDRFCKEGKVNLEGKLEPFKIHQNENELPDYLPNENGKILNNDFFGGNFKGIEKKLPYLKSLGVEVIYLNPIFKAYSNHRYDTADYRKCDEMLGTEKDFKHLCDSAHKHSISIILDGVFSHTGSDSIYFDKLRRFEKGAYYDKNSPYISWFDFKKYPDDYTSWWGIDTLPCTNELDESFLDYIIEGEDSVIAHWLRLGADGFRLDVADELPDEFIKRLRNRLKQIKPDALLIGEVWEDASNKISYSVRRRYFTNSELDCTMNYPFRSSVLDFVSGKINAECFRHGVLDICENYPREALLCAMNSLSTHDTVRALTALSGENISSKSEMAGYKMDKDKLKQSLKLLSAAVFLQFALPGMPCIYYGDEIGTEGFGDPFCRSFFDWSKVENNELLELHRSLSKLRAQNKELTLGELDIEALGERALKLTRSLKNKKVICILNLSEQKIECEGKVLMLSNSYKDEKIYVEPFGFAILRED